MAEAAGDLLLLCCLLRPLTLAIGLSFTWILWRLTCHVQGYLDHMFLYSGVLISLTHCVQFLYRPRPIVDFRVLQMVRSILHAVWRRSSDSSAGGRMRRNCRMGRPRMRHGTN